MPPSNRSRNSPKVSHFQSTPCSSAASGMPSTLRHHPAQVVGVAVVQRREREPAVAADHGGDAVHARRARGGVPEELRVVVRVRVDEPGRDHEAGRRRSRRWRRSSIVADGDDAPVGDPDVGDHARAPGAVDHGRALDDLVEHWVPRSPAATAAKKSDGASDCSLGPPGPARADTAHDGRPQGESDGRLAAARVEAPDRGRARRRRGRDCADRQPRDRRGRGRGARGVGRAGRGGRPGRPGGVPGVVGDAGRGARRAAAGGGDRAWRSSVPTWCR